MKVFKKELHILKKKQNSVIFLNDNFSDLLISEANADAIFFMLFVNFWMNLDVEENFSVSVKSSQDVQ